MAGDRLTNVPLDIQHFALTSEIDRWVDAHREPTARRSTVGGRYETATGEQFDVAVGTEQVSIYETNGRKDSQVLIGTRPERPSVNVQSHPTGEPNSRDRRRSRYGFWDKQKYHEVLREPTLTPQETMHEAAAIVGRLRTARRVVAF